MEFWVGELEGMVWKGKVHMKTFAQTALLDYRVLSNLDALARHLLQHSVCLSWCNPLRFIFSEQWFCDDCPANLASLEASAFSENALTDDTAPLREPSFTVEIATLGPWIGL